MYIKEFTVLLILWVVEAFGITVEPQYSYRGYADDVSQYIAPSTRKIVNKRPPKSVSSNEEDLANLKYILVLKPRSPYTQHAQAENLNTDEYASDGKPQEIAHPIKPPRSYLPRYVPQPTLSETSQHPVIPSKLKNHEIPASYDQAIANYRPATGLPKSAAALNLEKLIRQGQAIQNAEDNSQIVYQAHGFAGPKTYKFGYDTGKGRNHQFRDEESIMPGYIKGRYGYTNPRGRTTVVKYVASPESGFRIEKFQ